MTRAEKQPYQTENNRFRVGNETVPWFSAGEKSEVTIAPFPDHGRPVFLSSLIKTNPLFLEVARSLNQDDSKKANARIRFEIERYLDQGESAKSVTVFSSKDNSKPDIQVATIGNPYDGLRLYYHRGEINGVPAFFVDAIAKTKDTKRIEKTLEISGYSAPKKWNSGNGKTTGRHSI